MIYKETSSSPAEILSQVTLDLQTKLSPIHPRNPVQSLSRKGAGPEKVALGKTAQRYRLLEASVHTPIHLMIIYFFLASDSQLNICYKRIS